MSLSDKGSLMNACNALKPYSVATTCWLCCKADLDVRRLLRTLGQPGQVGLDPQDGLGIRPPVRVQQLPGLALQVFEIGTGG